MKSVPVSVRLSQEEVEFLARLEIQGANTPSEKLRAIIHETRQRMEEPDDFAQAIKDVNQWLSPVFLALQQSESEQELYSSLMASVRDWLPELLAFVLSNGPRVGQRQDLPSLQTLERGVTERLFRILESLLQQAMPSRCRCYDPDVLRQRSELVTELAQTLLQVKEQQSKESS